MLGKKLINAGPVATGGANTFASENFNTVLYTGNGSTQRIGGYINRGAVFNGSSSYIDLGSEINTTYVTPTGSFSASTWVNFASVGSSIQQIICWDTNANIELALNGRSQGAGKIVLSLWKDSVYVDLLSTTSISVNTWYHITVTHNNGSWSLYINGSLESTGTKTIVQPTTSVVLGKRKNNSQYLDGKLDQVRFFNKALSSSEVTTLYGETHASTTISTTDIFDDNSGVALYQLDGNANDTGGVSGKFGSAAIFNGSNSEISTEGEPIPATSNFSISFWINRNTSSDSDLFNQATSSGDIRTYFKLDSNGTFRVFSAGTNGSRIQVPNTTSAITNGQWEHIAIVRDGSNMTFYINGTGETETISGGTVGVGRGDMIIGSASASPDARIDDIRIYSDALTLTEVGYIYNNTTASIPTDNLVAYYKLDGDARDEQQLYDGTATNVTYAYDGTATNVTYQEATNFQPDLVWIKERTSTSNHTIIDVVRGTNSQVYTNLTNAATTSNFTSFDSNGFTLGTDNGLNENSQDYAAWCFKGGGTAVSNTDGNITSSVSANQDAGFSIVEYTSTASTSTIGHGLSAAPELMILKSTTNTGDWQVYSSATGNTKKLILNSTSGASTSAVWNNTSPTSTVFTSAFNNVGDVIAYCFHSVDGYSKIGSYTGNGSASGPIVETGFEPAWIMIKSSSTTAHWNIVDNKRDTSNPATQRLFANLSNAESAGINVLDFTSNGFQIKNSDVGFNGNTQTYIYLAIAADPDTTTPTVENSFDVVTWTGNGSSQDIETDFKPDFVWVKERTTAEGHRLYDSVRGATKHLNTMNTAAEATNTGGLTSFDDGGFNIGNYAPVNTNGEDYVAWVWKAGDHDDNLPQINTEGSIDSVVSVNAEAGFSIVKYTGNNTAGATIGHGLSQAPDFIIVKNLDTTDIWTCYQSDLGYNKYIDLSSTNAATTNSAVWYAAPTSTTFSFGANPRGNGSGNDIIAYCFHSVSGYQKIGSYTGNGTSVSSTNTITTGFQPRWIMFKCTTAADQWIIFDNARGTVANVTDTYLLANLSQAEADLNDGNQVEFLSNGFKITGNGRYFNQNSETYIYLAIK